MSLRTCVEPGIGGHTYSLEAIVRTGDRKQLSQREQSIEMDLEGAERCGEEEVVTVLGV